MPKRSRKPADLNRLAAAIVGDATDEGRKKSKSRRLRSDSPKESKARQKR